MKKICLLIGVALFLWGCGAGIRAQAAQEEAARTGAVDEFLEELDLEEIDRGFQELQGRTPLKFAELVKGFLRGEVPLTPEQGAALFEEEFFARMGENKRMAVRILVLLAAAALFTNFIYVSEKSQAADISFYMMYLGLFTLLMQAFGGMEQMTGEVLDQIIGFMKLLMPSYLLASVFASGAAAGGGFYELTLGMILVIQWILRYGILPAVNLYVLFSMLNHLAKEDYLSKLAELLKTFVEWSLKTLTAMAVGLQTVQCLILPTVDALKTTTLVKSAGAVPGLGNLFGGVTEVVLGSAVLIKNAVGAAGLVFLALLCLAPLAKLGAGAFLYRLLAAAAQPVSDKRMVECVSSAGDGAALLLKVLLTVGVLFFISIAMAAASIGG